MTELVKVLHNDVFTDSMVIAEGTGNQHKNVKELILKYENDIKDFGTLSVSNGESTGGRPLEFFLLNEEQATFVMTLLRNSKKVVAFKKELVRQFYQLRRLIMERQSPSWQQARAEGKKARRMETDAIKEFVSYAQDHGSKSADKYYIHYSKLADKAVGITDRDSASTDQLLNLRVVEMMIDKAVLSEITAGTEYHQAFKNVKVKVQQVAELAFKPRIAIAG